MKTVSIDVGAEESAQQLAEKILDATALEAATAIRLRVLAPRGVSKWVRKILGGDRSSLSRAARGSALLARGYREITGEIDASGDDVVAGVS